MKMFSRAGLAPISVSSFCKIFIYCSCSCNVRCDNCVALKRYQNVATVVARAQLQYCMFSFMLCKSFRCIICKLFVMVNPVLNNILQLVLNQGENIFKLNENLSVSRDFPLINLKVTLPVTVV